MQSDSEVLIVVPRLRASRPGLYFFQTNKGNELCSATSFASSFFLSDEIFSSICCAELLCFLNLYDVFATHSIFGNRKSRAGARPREQLFVSPILFKEKVFRTACKID
ncbi:unnamed protein product [Amoebophrya sp. A120]|nr:unnamed protein product [Amoebophrya sp. A120]|eukprot:GSA120T00000223001.1